ncbi:helicase HerA domain-containing protein, partial [Streptomyces scabiei]
PIAHDAPIAVDPDKLFGRHLAVLGNTGSGKSCTLAALVRSAVESAQKSLKKPEIPEGAEEAQNGQANPNARFIILDPNGEYSKCFQDLGA